MSILSDWNDAMTSYEYEDNCRILSNEALEELSKERGSWGYYARVELANRYE
jgi:hypothetical protein